MKRLLSFLLVASLCFSQVSAGTLPLLGAGKPPGAAATGPISAVNLTSGSGGSVTSINTASVSPSADKLLLLSVFHVGTAGSVSTPTITGNGLTWVLVDTRQQSTSNRFSMFRAMGASPSAGVVTIDFTTETMTAIIWTLDEISNVLTTGTSGSGAIVQSANNVTNTTATSFTVTLSAFGSVNNGTYGAFSSANNTPPITPGSGFTEIREFTNAGIGRTIDSEYKVANDTSVDWTYGSVFSLNIGIAVELAKAP